MNNEETIIAVENMQQFISRNLDKPITLSMLAKTANYSQWHCSRIFTELTGKTPFEYIRALRLTTAARKLRDGKEKILDIAFDFVFDTHEGFTRSFTKQFGISPLKYRKNPVPLRYFIPYSVLGLYLYNKKGDKKMEKAQTRTVFVQAIERPRRKAIIKRGIKATHYFEYCEEVGCDIWGVLESIKEAMFEPAGFWLPEKLITPGTSKYVQGVEVATDYKGAAPEGYDIIDLEPSTLLVFQGQPFADEDFEEAISEIWDAIDKYNPEAFGYRWADKKAPRFQLAPLGYRGYMEARPVEKL
ncbi:MAG: AraC family transcriptional regulator [Clostridia bacterium]|nr:AraC family transcriptional regulator [Clostridia bacterium]